MNKENNYELDELKTDGQTSQQGSDKSSPFDDAMVSVEGDMVRFEQELADALEPQKKYLTETELGIYKRGKKLRPLLLILSARMIQGSQDLSTRVIKASVSLEMLHVASLIHDDIIDNALLRRGLKSVNASRGTSTAILVGDLQFLQAIRNFIDVVETESEMGLVKLVLDTAFKVCTGELDEISTDPSWSTKKLKQRYFDVIERKTALMFGLACEIGVALADGDTSDSRRLGFYGRRIGRAFQIMDDILDFLQTNDKSGKTAGIDLEQARITLPIIYAMEEFGNDHYITRHFRKEQPLVGNWGQAMDEIKNTNALSYAYADAREEALDALRYLRHFPDSSYKTHLEKMAMYIVDRQF
jgi:heptaprenyl diphosphate synthase